MRNFFHKPYRWAAVYALTLVCVFIYSLMDAFVIPRAVKAVGTQAGVVVGLQTDAQAAEASPAPAESVDGTAAPADDTGAAATPSTAPTAGEPVITDNSYTDANMSIQITSERVDDTNVYIADVQLNDASLLKTALADNTFGRNIKETTSDMAADHSAILAINGDYYGFRGDGYVVRNGELYRDIASSDDSLAIDQNGDFSIISAGSATDDDALQNMWQVLTFGPALIENGQIVVDANSEISGKSEVSNPRTAIGQAGPLHYIIIVSDGRTSESAGLSLLDLAQIFDQYGCTTAYNIDGGGSSTMVFNGQVVNEPTTGGRRIGEREVSDIVYLGYK
jgi:exopolysaccharide biosynthesis protein